MHNVQEVWDRIQGAAKERKEIKAAYKNALEGSGEYLQVSEQLATLKEKKREIETSMKLQLSDETEKLETLTRKIAEDKQLLSDMALNALVKGEQVSIVGPRETPYEPMFVVQFKRKR
jgi:DNA repair exonuclease SbcCD ATPase subunit